ncbi:MAG: L,D-transpeptidase family protein [Betaproteobacteria bacterium]|nr:L,D-transpeptidase family protein [Betaproteobacteria bacterium]
MPRSLLARSLCLLAVSVLILVALPGHAGQPRRSAHLSGADAQFKSVLETIERGRLDVALSEVDRLIARYPNFRLAHLVRGDLLLARAKPIELFGNTGHGASERLDELRAEAYVRLRAYIEHPSPDLIPRYLIQFAPTQKNAIVVDGGRSRVYVYENANGMPRLVEDYYTTLGKRGIEKLREGDKKTPVGVYEVTSRIPGNKLPDLYGWGAFPINYPNEWDRMLGKTGYGIWLHGVPSDTYARAPWASDGCIALANPDIEELAKRVQPGNTPVILADRVEWLTPEAWRAERDAFMRQLETWRADWESLDAARYLSHYARNFRSDGMDLAAWKAHKRKVNKGKTWIKVSLNNMSVFRSPGKQSLIAVTYDQGYRSNNLTQRTRKRQYWTIEDGRWKIAHEGPVRRAALALPESFPRKRR